jgi:serine/threonine protein kinase
MGEVFAAENIRTGRPVAVKLLRADSKTKSSAVERFRREARAAGSINSDHVTQVLDVEDDAEHGIVIVFELLEGESLIDRLKRTGPIPFDELHPIIEEVWVGLSDAHKVGIIHRDLKPSNVFLERRPDGQQRVKILDFGISKLPKEMGGETLTEMGQSLGTFSFMPPEQIGRAKTVDHRADIYATTTMIYQSLTGQLPYVARNILVMVEMKSKTDPRPISEALGHQVDPELEKFVATGLARDPYKRFQNALDALEKWRALRHLSVPASRRSVRDLKAMGRLAMSGSSPPPAPLPAAGRPPSGAYQMPTPVPLQAATRLPASVGYAPPSTVPVPASALAPAPVVPAGMLDAIPGPLPRLYDQTESTTDISRVEVIPGSQESGASPPGRTPVPDSSGVQPSAGVAQRGQELRGGGQEVERKGPQGTRVMPPSVVQAAVSFAEARKASQAQAAQQVQQGVAHAQQSIAHAQQSAAHAQAPSQIGAPIAAAQAAQPRPGSQQDLRSPHPTPWGQQRPEELGAPRPQQPSHPLASMSAATPMSGVQPAQPLSAPPPSPSPSQLGVPSSGVQAMMRASAPSDPRANPSSAPPPISSGVQQSGQHPAHQSGALPAPQLDARPPSLPPQTPQQMAHGSGPIQLATMRLPDEQSSIPASQDKTTVYRPRKKAPQKKQSVALYVLGAFAFAIVGFSIVYVVQYLVRSLH